MFGANRGTSLNNQITFLNPLTEGNQENEETPVEHPHAPSPGATLVKCAATS
jgi:hypothetical protein